MKFPRGGYIEKKASTQNLAIAHTSGSISGEYSREMRCSKRADQTAIAVKLTLEVSKSLLPLSTAFNKDSDFGNVIGLYRVSEDNLLDSSSQLYEKFMQQIIGLELIPISTPNECVS